MEIIEFDFANTGIPRIFFPFKNLFLSIKKQLSQHKWQTKTMPPSSQQTDILLKNRYNTEETTPMRTT